MKNKKIGYTTGVFDLFHTGHLAILRKARENCDYLIVGVCSDDLVEKMGRSTVMDYESRKDIVEAIRYVDKVICEEETDKIHAWKNLHFNIIFKGDDWKGTSQWNLYESFFNEHNVQVMYFPYTHNISSTQLRGLLSVD